MPEMKGVTVRIPDDLHAEVKAYLESHGMTMGEFITQAVDHELHPKFELKEDKSMERMRTLAFQVPESLFQRVKSYLERNHMSQKQFVIGLIEAELEQDEAQYQAAHPEEQEDEETDEQAEEETQDGPESQLEEQPADQENAAPVDDFEEVSQEDGGPEEPEEAQETEETSQDSEESEELDQIEDFEDSGMEEISEDSLEDGEFQEGEETWEDELSEEPQDEEEEQAYQPSMAW